MSNNARPATEVPFNGLALVTIAIACAGGYFQYSRLVKSWPGSMHALFWGVVVILLAFGLQQLAAAYWPGQASSQLRKVGKNHFVLPREGLLYLAIMIVLLMGSMLGNDNMLLLVFSMMTGPFVVNGATSLTMLKGARIARQAPPRAMVGELFSVDLLLQNQQSYLSSWMMQAIDVIEGPGWRGTAEVLFTRVPPRSTQPGHYDLRLNQRGRYQFGPLQIISRFPLSLVERGLPFNLYSEVLIYPRIGRLSPNWRRRLAGANEQITQSQTRLGVYQDEFHHLREFRRGDSPRSIHWRSSARRNELIAQQYQENREHRLALVVELWRGPAEARGAVVDEQLELLLSFVATMCVEYRRTCRQSEMHLTLVGDRTVTWRGEATSSLEPVLDELATIQAAASADASAALEELLGQVGPETRVCLLTTRPMVDPTTSHGHGQPGSDAGRTQNGATAHANGSQEPISWLKRAQASRVQIVWAQVETLKAMLIYNDEGQTSAVPAAPAVATAALGPGRTERAAATSLQEASR